MVYKAGEHFATDRPGALCRCHLLLPPQTLELRRRDLLLARAPAPDPVEPHPHFRGAISAARRIKACTAAAQMPARHLPAHSPASNLARLVPPPRLTPCVSTFRDWLLYAKRTEGATSSAAPCGPGVRMPALTAAGKTGEERGGQTVAQMWGRSDGEQAPQGGMTTCVSLARMVG